MMSKTSTVCLIVVVFLMVRANLRACKWPMRFRPRFGTAWGNHVERTAQFKPNPFKNGSSGSDRFGSSTQTPDKSNA